MLNDKQIKACVSRHDNGANSRMQFLATVSHSMGAHTEALCLTADSSSSDEDETMRRHQRQRQSRQNRQRQNITFM